MADPGGRDPGLDRGDFRELSGAAAAGPASGIPLFHFHKEARAAGAGGGEACPREARLGSWEDLYRKRWA